jgi:dihydrofolate reductase
MSPAAPRVTLVVARARDGAIGRGNTLPWHLPEDLKHFKATTLGHPIVMGRRTFESIGRPLPGRRTIVVTTAPDWQHPGCERAGSLDEAIGLCAGATEVFVVGGARLFEAALPRADRLVVTEIDLEVPDADTFFPPVDTGRWRCTDRRDAVGASGLAYAILTWERAGEGRENP